jgi:hypothetical protein
MAIALGWAVTTLALSFYLLADGCACRRALRRRTARLPHAAGPHPQNLELIVGVIMLRPPITAPIVEARRLMDSVSWAAVLPQTLAALGAMFAAVVDVIPFIGGLLATAPAVLSALSRGWPAGLVVLGALFIYQEFENRIVVPRVYGRALRLAPTTVILALVAGGVLLGVIGALLALPIAAGLQMMLAELRVEMPGDDSADRSELARNVRTEATYERMSAGATAPEAGRIARTLAHERFPNNRTKSWHK